MSRSNKRKPSVPEKSYDENQDITTPNVLLAKARVMSGSEVEPSQALSAIDDTNQQFSSAQAVVPRYDPESLLRYVEITPHLRPCIDAMGQNIDGYGYRWAYAQPWMEDLDSEEATAAIQQALEIEQWVDEQEAALDQEQEKKGLLERLNSAEVELELALEKSYRPRTLKKYETAAQEAQKALEDLEAPPTMDQEEPAGEEAEGVSDEGVEEVREMLRIELRREQYLFGAWFKNCSSDRSFTELRRNVREDIKAHGWGCLEYLRDGYGRLKRLNYVSGYTVRPLVTQGELVDVTEDDSVTPLSEGREVLVKRRFQIYVQIVGGKKVYFKSPGDPRIVSKTTGKVYKDESALRRPTDAENPGEGKDAEAANEIMYIAEHDPTSPCPPPVWIGNLVAVLGVREADETNYYYLADNAIPAGLLFVHGGRIAKNTKMRLESRIKNELAGSQGSGKLLVVEANPTGKAPNERSVLPSISFESLRDSQQSDALFTKYDERTADRIGASFRLPPLLRGYTPANLNRATAIASLYFAEQQVFQPERDEFDWKVNKYLMPEIGLKYVDFASNSPPIRSAEEVAKLIQATSPTGAWTPNDTRAAIGEAMNRPMAHIDEEWGDTPMILTLSGGAAGGGGAPPEEGSISELNQRLSGIELRVQEIISEELRALGMEMDVRASFVDVDVVDEEDEEGDG